MMKQAAALLLVALLAACGRDETETIPGAADPATEFPTTRDDVPANDPANLAFIREGRTLHFGGREWRLVGEPVFNPILRYVGTAEGIDLYATPEGRAPSESLFFHLGNDRWQSLQPVPGPTDPSEDTMVAVPDTQRVPPR
jgi:hypothetical protein